MYNSLLFSPKWPKQSALQQQQPVSGKLSKPTDDLARQNRLERKSPHNTVQMMIFSPQHSEALFALAAVLCFPRESDIKCIYTNSPADICGEKKEPRHDNGKRAPLWVCWELRRQERSEQHFTSLELVRNKFLLLSWRRVEKSLLQVHKEL